LREKDNQETGEDVKKEQRAIKGMA